MRSIILREDYLREALDAVLDETRENAIIATVRRIVKDKCCSTMTDDIMDAITEADYDLPSSVEAAEIFDAIMDQTQRVGTVTDLI